MKTPTMLYYTADSNVPLFGEETARIYDIQSRKSDETMWRDIKKDWQIIESELKEEIELKKQIEKAIV